MPELIAHSLYFLAGLSLYAAIVHLTIGIRRPSKSTHLVFSLMCLSMTGICIAQLRSLDARTIPEYVDALTWVLNYVGVTTIILVWFITSYRGLRSGAYVYLGVICVLAAGLSALNMSEPYTLQYSHIDRLEPMVLPWGESVLIARGAPNPLFVWALVWTISTWALCLYHLVDFYLSGKRKEGTLMLFGFGLFLVGNAEGMLVRAGFLNFLPLGIYGSVGMLLFMGAVLQMQYRDRTELFKAVLDSVPTSVLVKDIDGRYVMMNRYFERAFGIRPGDGIGKSDADYFPPAQVAEFRANDANVVATRERLDVVETADHMGETRQYHMVKFPLFDSFGELVSVAGVATDITERIRSEQALQESEARFRGLADSAPMFIWVTDSDRKCSYVNKPWLEFTGRTPDNSLGGLWSNSVHPDDYVNGSSVFLKYVEARTPFQMEWRVRSHDGQYRWFLNTAVPRFDPKRQFIGYIGCGVDIHDRKQLEFDLIRQTQRLDAVFALSPDGFVVTDDRETVMLVNAAFTRLTGIGFHELVGRPISALDDLLLELVEDRPRFRGVSTVVSAVSGYRDVGPRMRLQLRRPLKRVLDVTGRRGEDQQIGVILSFTDMTHEIEVEQMKSEFLAVAAHELRTPTTSILGFSELLISQSFTEAERIESLGIIHEQSLRISQVLDELLDLVRIESRRGMDFNFEPFDLAKLVMDTLPTASIDPELWPVRLTAQESVIVRGDLKKVHKVLMNVLSNARKFSPSGGPIEISIERKVVGDECRVTVAVTDHGIGMSAENVERVCERFFRADESGTIAGAGLGMAIAKEIMEIQNGGLNIESVLGRGTTVSIWLPAARS